MRLDFLLPLTTAFLLLWTGCQTTDSLSLRGKPHRESIPHSLPVVLTAVESVLRDDGYVSVKVDARRGSLEAQTPVGLETGRGNAGQRHARVRLSETTPGVTEVSLLFSRIEEGGETFSGGAAHQIPVRDSSEYRRFFKRVEALLHGETPAPVPGKRLQ